MGNTCSLSTEVCGFQCTGYSGSHVWKKWHADAESIECGQCQDHAVKMMKGLHDHVNAGLGEKVFDHDNYIKFADEVACVKSSYCKRTGKC